MNQFYPVLKMKKPSQPCFNLRAFVYLIGVTFLLVQIGLLVINFLVMFARYRCKYFLGSLNNLSIRLGLAFTVGPPILRQTLHINGIISHLTQTDVSKKNYSLKQEKSKHMILIQVNGQNIHFERLKSAPPFTL